MKNQEVRIPEARGAVYGIIFGIIAWAVIIGGTVVVLHSVMGLPL